MPFSYQIQDVIDVDVLQKIQDEFALSTDFSVIVVDAMGKPVTRHSNCSEFCSRMRRDPISQEFCQCSDALGGLEAARRGKPYIYQCHSGLVDFAAPIFYQGQYLGAMMAGQVLVAKEDLQALEVLCPSPFTPKEGFSQHLEKSNFPVLSIKKIQAVAETMSLFCNHIVAQGITYKIQQDLHQKEQELLKNRQRQLELENALKETKLKVLHSQINPHFLFNALNTISSLSLIEDAPKTREVTYVLSDILRYTLNKTSKMVSLQEEAHYIRRYLEFQQTRFNDRLKFHIDIPHRLRAVEIPFMTMQPLVENAVIHGLEPKEKGGMISIRAYVYQRDVLISIEDDGVGMSQEKIQRFNEKKEIASKEPENSSSHTTGLGMHNVNDRLIHYFGGSYGLKIHSALQEGTRILITLPGK